MRIFLSILLLAACSPEQPALAPTPMDQVPEVSYDADAILRDFADEGAFFTSPILDAPLGATRVGVLGVLRDAEGVVPALEARGDGGAWIPLEITWREGDQFVAVADLGLNATAAQIRVRAEDRDRIGLITHNAVVPVVREPDEEILDDDIGASRQALRADIAALGVIPRETWGARSASCSDDGTAKYRFAIHHTVTPSDGDPASRLRGIQNYHMDSNGWCDVGYHFLVSLDGRTWEGRPIQDLGAHVGGHNSGNIGVSFIGCFHTSSCGSYPPNVPPDTMVNAGAELVAGLGGIFGISPNGSTVLGHRDHPGATTSCPGDHLHARLGDIRNGTVAPPGFAAQYVAQSFPLARDPFELAPGQIVDGFLEMRNVGGQPWTPGQTFLGTTEPRDVASPIASPTWISPGRAATIDRVVNPGETGRFNFSVRGPGAPGDYPQYFNLVQEGVAWFSDTGHGGPPDNQIQIRVTVVPGVPPVDAGPPPMIDAGMIDPGSDAGLDDGGVVFGDGGDRMMLDGGCGCRASDDRSAPVWLIALGLALFVRRRAR
jgi:MYXO-CTERM domain-containing protein